MTDTGADESASSTQKLGDIIKPTFTLSQILHAASQIYGFSVTSHKQLDSYDDINILAQVSKVEGNVHITDVCSHGYIIKVINSNDSKKLKLADAQMGMMKHLRDHGISTPRPAPQKDGGLKCFLSQRSGEEQLYASPIYDKPFQSVTDQFEKRHVIFCLECLPGQTLITVPYTTSLMHKSGVLLGNFNSALVDFSHDGYTGVKSIWQMQHAGKELLSFSFAVKDDQDRAMVEEIMHTMQSQVLDKPDGLRRGCIHGDFNEGNILVKLSSEIEVDYDFCAVIDYGDSHEDYVVMDLCGWLAYVIMLCKDLPPIIATGHVIAGFLSRFELTTAEKKVLRIGAAARMAQSITLGAYNYVSQPGDNAYLLTTAAGWPRLREFWSLSDAQVTEQWNSVLGQYGLKL